MEYSGLCDVDSVSGNGCIFACFCVFNKLWQYIPVLCMVIAVLEFLPYYVFVARLGENVVTKYIISCLEDKDL